VRFVSLSKAWIDRYITDSDEHISVQLIAYQAMLEIMYSCLYDIVCLSGLKECRSVMAKINRDVLGFGKFCGLLRQDVVNIVEESRMKQIVGEVVEMECLMVDEWKVACGGVMPFATTEDVVINFEVVKERVKWRGRTLLKRLGCNVRPGQDPIPWITTLFETEWKKDGHGAEEKQKTQGDFIGTQSQSQSLSFDVDF
jgi:hypothetical protein